MQGNCRGKKKGSNMRMKESNSDKLGHFKMVKTILYTSVQDKSLSFSPSTIPRPQGNGTQESQDWNCHSKFGSYAVPYCRVISAPHQLVIYNCEQLRGISIWRARKKPNFPLLPWAHPLTFGSSCILWRTIGEVYSVCLSHCTSELPPHPSALDDTRILTQHHGFSASTAILTWYLDELI